MNNQLITHRSPIDCSLRSAISYAWPLRLCSTIRRNHLMCSCNTHLGGEKLWKQHMIQRHHWTTCFWSSDQKSNQMANALMLCAQCWWTFKQTWQKLWVICFRITVIHNMFIWAFSKGHHCKANLCSFWSLRGDFQKNQNLLCLEKILAPVDQTFYKIHTYGNLFEFWVLRPTNCSLLFVIFAL